MNTSFAEFIPSDIHKFHPNIQKYVKELMKLEQSLGIYNGPIQISKITNCKKYAEDEEMNYANRFTLSIPYAGHYLQWTVIFSNDDPSFAPDLDVGDDTFLGDFDVDTITEAVPSLGQWNPECSKSLMQVLKEFFNMYKKYQVNLLEDNDKYSRPHLEYMSLIRKTNIRSEDVEVLIDDTDVICFLISLSIDFDELPCYLFKCETPMNPGYNSVLLMVKFHRLDGSMVRSELFMSPHIEQALGTIKNRDIPAFTASTCLVDYVSEIQALVVNKVKRIVDNYNMRNKYISYLTSQFRKDMVECDYVSFSKASLLFKNNNFHWLLYITLDSTFPKNKPTWMLRSVYHTGAQNVYTNVLEDYPYSPRWGVEEMIARAITYMNDKLLEFKSNCTTKYEF